MALNFIVSKYYTVVLETFDGEQYGMLPLCVKTYSKDEAERIATKEAEDDGWQRVKVQFTMED